MTSQAVKDHRDRACLDFISGRLRNTAIPPTYEEMASALGLRSKASIKRILDRLVAAGRIRQMPNRARALDVIHGPPTASPRVIPLVSYPDAKMFVWSDEAKALVPMERSHVP